MGHYLCQGSKIEGGRERQRVRKRKRGRERKKERERQRWKYGRRDTHTEKER